MSEEITLYIQHLEKQLEAVENGDLEVFGLAIELNLLEKQIKSFKSRIKEHVFDQLAGDKTIGVGDYTITKVNGKKTYKYNHIKQWNDTKAQMKEIEETAKKLVGIKAASFSEETGEQLEAAVVSSSAESYSIKYVKPK